MTFCYQFLTKLDEFLLKYRFLFLFIYFFSLFLVHRTSFTELRLSGHGSSAAQPSSVLLLCLESIPRSPCVSLTLAILSVLSLAATS